MVKVFQNEVPVLVVYTQGQCDLNGKDACAAAFLMRSDAPVNSFFRLFWTHPTQFCHKDEGGISCKSCTAAHGSVFQACLSVGRDRLSLTWGRLPWLCKLSRQTAGLTAVGFAHLAGAGGAFEVMADAYNLAISHFVKPAEDAAE